MVAGWISKAGGDIDWSSGVDALLGLSGKPFGASLELLLSFLDPDDEGAVAALRGGLLLDAPLPVRFMRRDGAVRHALLSPCDGLPGCEDHLILSVEDLEPAREREAALSGARRLEASICEQMLDSLLVLDRKFLVVHANESARRTLPRDPLGRILWELYPTAIGGRFWRHVREVMETGGLVEDEHLSPELGGWIRYRLAPFADGVLCVCRHVDEVHHLRTLLQDFTERVDVTLDGARMAMWQHDLRSDRLWVSDGPCDLIGSGQMTRKALLDRIAEDDRGAVRRMLEAACHARAPFETEFRCPGAARPHRIVRMRGAWVPASSGRPDRLAGIAIDMGEPEAREREGEPGSGGGTPQSARDLTGAQVRAARGLLRWSVRELAERSRVSVATINRIETGDGVPSARSANLVALHAALSRAGARILTTVEHEPAIALARKSCREALEPPTPTADERDAA